MGLEPVGVAGGVRAGDAVSTLHLYRVRITMEALVAAESENAAETIALKDREVINDVRDSAVASAYPVRDVSHVEGEALAYGVPDEHPWRDMPVEKIVAEIAARKVPT